MATRFSQGVNPAGGLLLAGRSEEPEARFVMRMTAPEGGNENGGIEEVSHRERVAPRRLARSRSIRSGMEALLGSP